jgi:hypothetical protein
MTRIKIYMLITLLFIWNPLVLYAATTDTITQYGITWTFSEAKEYGTFANGDYWVIGPVTINSITPDFAAERNGWQVNPSAILGQGFDGRCNSYDATLVPDLPYTASAGESIIKMISAVTGTSEQRTQTAAVLTVLASTPAGNGAGLFRPGYASTDKTLYAVADLHTDRLLTMTTTEPGVSYATINAKFSKVQVEHASTASAVGRCIRPIDNMTNSYTPYFAGKLNDAIAKLNGNDTEANKQTSLIYVVQAGIDTYNATLGGQEWPDGSGHEPGHKLAVAFAAYMLDNQGMKDAVTNTFWYENRYFKDSLYGMSSVTEVHYWQYVGLDPGYNQDYWDPYRQIDGGTNITRDTNSYQVIVGNNVKGSANWLRYYPVMAAFWSDSTNFISYGVRWAATGQKALPDTCAPMDAVDIGKVHADFTKYGVTYGPDGSGGCIAGAGRFSDGRDGTNADGGQYVSAQMDEMFDLYEGVAPVVTAFTIPATSTSLTVTISSFTATDAVGVTGYCLQPTNSSTGCTWTASSPLTYPFGTQGAKTLYAFAKDAAGNISTNTETHEVDTDGTTITLVNATGTAVRTAGTNAVYGSGSNAVRQ